MVKKIVIPVVVFVAMTTTAFLKVKEVEEKRTENTAVEAVYTPVVVLELFTSQGCSSCPPADVVLDELKDRFPSEVFALSYHVDYWNYIGWEDPFSKSSYTQKQRFYNRKFKYRSNYTPQLVVNGREHFVGSNKAKAYAKVDQYASLKAPNQLAIKGTANEAGRVGFEYEIEGPIAAKQLRAVLVLNERTTVVKRGENRNRTLKNSNIVVAETYIKDLASAGKASIWIPPIVGKNEALTLMLFTETEDLDITAAAKKAL